MSNLADSMKGYGECCKTVGDIIDVYLDLESENKKLCFALKDKYYDVAEDMLDEGEYCLHVTFGVSGLALDLEIIDFEEVKSLP